MILIPTTTVRRNLELELLDQDIEKALERKITYREAKASGNFEEYIHFRKKVKILVRVANVPRKLGSYFVVKKEQKSFSVTLAVRSRLTGKSVLSVSGLDLHFINKSNQSF